MQTMMKMNDVSVCLFSRYFFASDVWFRAEALGPLRDNETRVH